MIDIEQLAKAAYKAHCDHLRKEIPEAQWTWTWDQLAPSQQQAWCAAVTKVLDLAEVAIV